MWPANQPPAAAAAYSNGGIQIGDNKIAAGPMPLDALSKQLEEVRQRVMDYAARVRSTADVLFGSEPEPKEAATGIKPAPFGKLGSLNDQASIIHSALSELERQIGRLNPLG